MDMDERTIEGGITVVSEAAPADTGDPPVRRVGLQHVAFFRAYLEGIDVTEAADRYLDFGKHHLKAKAAQRWILGRFLQAARRYVDTGDARIGDARVLRIPPSSMSAEEGDLSLEAFAAERDPDGVLSEDDLIELFRVEYAQAGGKEGESARRQLRNMRLRKRQFRVLECLQRIVVENPLPEHHVMGWLDPSAALKLTDAGVQTIGQLMGVIAARGYRWWTKVPGLGEMRAQRIVAWLGESQKSLKRELPKAALVPRRKWTHEIAATVPQRAGIAPLDAFIVPGELNGERGLMRAPADALLIDARNDMEAVQFWLSGFSNKVATTQRKYRVEAERLMLWAIVQKGKALSSLNLADAEEFINVFLPDPQPAERWVMHTNEARHSAGWRPFRGRLTLRSREMSLQIIKALFTRLYDAGYLKGSVFSLVKAKPFERKREDGTVERETKTRGLQIEHSLTAAQWDFLLDFAVTLPPAPDGSLSAGEERDVFLLMFAYGTGLRQQELAAASTSDVEESRAEDHAAAALELVVIGKGDVRRRVPLPAEVVERLSRYLASRGLPESPLDCPKGTPLIGKLGFNRQHTAGNLTGDHVAELLKRFFRRGALAAPDERTRATLLRASTHWMRHTFGSHALANGMEMDVARQSLGHASLDTTSVYSTVELERRHRQTRLFAERGFRRARDGDQREGDQSGRPED